MNRRTIIEERIDRLREEIFLTRASENHDQIKIEEQILLELDRDVQVETVQERIQNTSKKISDIREKRRKLVIKKYDLEVEGGDVSKEIAQLELEIEKSSIKDYQQTGWLKYNTRLLKSISGH